MEKPGQPREHMVNDETFYPRSSPTQKRNYPNANACLCCVFALNKSAGEINFVVQKSEKAI